MSSDQTDKTQTEIAVQEFSGAANNKRLKLEDCLSVFIMGVLALITFANVLVRYFSNQSFAWTEEISIFFLIILTMVGSSSAFVRYQHIRIEYFADNGSAAKKWWFSIASNASVLLFFVLFTVLSLKMALLNWNCIQCQQGLFVSNYPIVIRLALPPAAAVLVLMLCSCTRPSQGYCLPWIISSGLNP